MKGEPKDDYRMASLPLDNLLLDPKHYSFSTNTTFRGLTLSQTSEGWRVVVRAFLHDGTAVYALTEADDPHEALSRLLHVLASRTGEELWRADKYYQV